MPINIESTLTGIRQGGQLPGQTLAGQIGAMQQERKKQEFGIMQAMMEAQRKQQAEQRQSTKLAHSIQKDQREAQQARLFGIAQQVATMAERDPESAMQILQRSPRVAQAMGVDPRNPDLNRVVAFRDRMRAQIEGDIPESPEQWRPMTDQEREAYGVPQGQPAQINDTTGKMQTGGQTINIGGEDPTVMEKEADKAIVDEWTRYIESGDKAEQNLRNLEQIDASIDSGQFITGSLGNFRSGFGSLLSLAGVNPEDISDVIGNPEKADIIQAGSSLMQQRLAEDLGRVTNMSLSLVRDAMPGLLKTPEGNKVLVNLLRRVENFKLARADLAREYRQYGTDTPEGKPSYNDALAKLREQFMGITDEQRKIIEEAGNEGTWKSPMPMPPTTELLQENKVYRVPEGTPGMPDGGKVRYIGMEGGKPQFEVPD